MGGQEELPAVDRVFDKHELLIKILEYVYDWSIDWVSPDEVRLVNKRWFQAAMNITFRYCGPNKLILLEDLVDDGFNDYGSYVGELDIDKESLLEIILAGLDYQCRLTNLETFRLELFDVQFDFGRIAAIRRFVESIKHCTRLRNVSITGDWEQLATLIPMLVTYAPSAVFDIEILDRHQIRIDCSTLDALLYTLEANKVAVDEMSLLLFGFRPKKEDGDDIVRVSDTLRKYSSMVSAVKRIMIAAVHELHASFRSEYIGAIEIFAPQLTNLDVTLARTVDEDSSPIAIKLLQLLKSTKNLTYLRISVENALSCTIDDEWVKSLVECSPMLEQLSLQAVGRHPTFTIETFESLKSCRKLKTIVLRTVLFGESEGTPGEPIVELSPSAFSLIARDEHVRRMQNDYIQQGKLASDEWRLKPNVDFSQLSVNSPDVWFPNVTTLVLDVAPAIEPEVFMQQPQLAHHFPNLTTMEGVF